MDWLKERAGEASTWKGIGWLLVAFGILPAEAVPDIVAIGAAVIGAVEVVRREAGKNVR